MAAATGAAAREAPERAGLRALVRSDAAALGALTLLGAVLRFSTLSAQSYWADESMTVRLVRSPFHTMLSGVRQLESTPPLYYALGWGWSRLFGTSEAGLRSLSALIGTLTIPVLFAAGSALAGRRVGLVAAALAATSPYLVWYSQEARAYALLVLLGAASLALWVRVLDRPRTAWLAAWAVTSALAVWAHYFAGFLVGGEALVLLVVHRRRPAAWASVVGMGVLLLPLRSILQEQTRLGHADWIGSTPLGERIGQSIRAFAIGVNGTGAPASAQDALQIAYTTAALVLLAAALALLVWRVDPPLRRRAGLVAVVVGTAALLPVALVAVGRDYVFHRNLIAVWAPVALLAAVGLGAARNRRLATGLAAAACLLALSATVLAAADPSYQRENWRGVARAIGSGGARAPSSSARAGTRRSSSTGRRSWACRSRARRSPRSTSSPRPGSDAAAAAERLRPGRDARLPAPPPVPLPGRASGAARPGRPRPADRPLGRARGPPAAGLTAPPRAADTRGLRRKGARDEP